MFLALIPFYMTIFAFSLNDVFTGSISSKKKLYIFLLFFVITYSFFVSNIVLSEDKANYEYNFSLLTTIGDYIDGTATGRRYEAGFQLLNIIIKLFINNENYAVRLIVALCVLGVTYKIYQYSPQFLFFSLLIYIGRFYGWNGIILLRQTCALVILFPLLKLIPEKKYFKVLLLILFASLFHISSLLYVFVIPLYRIFQNKKFLIFSVIVSFIFGYFDIISRLIMVIAGFIPRGNALLRYILNQGKSGNIIAYLEMLFVLGIALYYKQKIRLNNKYADIAITYLGFAVVLTGLFQRFEIVNRFAMAFNFYAYIILLPAFICLLRKNWKERLVYVGILGTYLFVFFIRFYYILDKY